MAVIIEEQAVHKEFRKVKKNYLIVFYRHSKENCYNFKRKNKCENN
jgi:hypothetical protein